MTQAPEPGRERRMSGRMFVVLAAGASIAVALVILAVALVVGGPTDVDVACQETPSVCVTVRAYAAALNDRDAVRVRELMTEQGLRGVLSVGSVEELAMNLEALPSTDIIEELRITTVTMESEDVAIVRARFSRLNQGFDEDFRLVRANGDWLIDG